MDILYSVYARVTAMVLNGFRRQEGQTFTEYAVIVGVIAVGTVAAIGFLRDKITSALSDAANDI